MTRCNITATAAALIENSLRAANSTDALTKIQNEWSAIAHGVVPLDTIIAMLIITDALVQVTIWAVRKVRARREVRRAHKAEVIQTDAAITGADHDA